MPRKKLENKETLNEELEIETELSKDDLTPIQDKVDSLFSNVEVESESLSEDNDYKKILTEALEEYCEDGRILEENFDDLIESIMEKL